jgi:ribonuclease HI
MMTAPPAHYLLFTEATIDSSDGGTWRFVLEHVGAGEALSASDVEAVECAERLELFAVVRGLEALDQPAKVTLVTKSRYVGRGLKRGLADWQANGWHWERFGRVVPVRDHDLWRRVDRALQFHQVECRLWHFDAEAAEDRPQSASCSPQASVLRPQAASGWAAWPKKAAAALSDALRPTGLAAG